MREEFVDFRCRMCFHTNEHVGHILLQAHIVDLAGGDKRVERGNVLAGVVIAHKEKILSFTAVVSMLSGQCRFGKRGIQRLISDLSGVELSLGTVSNLEQMVSNTLDAPCGEVASYIPRQVAVNMDESVTDREVVQRPGNIALVLVAGLENPV